MDKAMQLSTGMRYYRTLFLSDLHLGANGCRSDRILDFLTQNTADTIYLVGDILDLWHPASPRWTAIHDRIMGLLADRADRGSRIIYLTGNHDDAVLKHRGAHSRFEIADFATHDTSDGRSYLVLHGDIVDGRILRWHICTRIGSRIDNFLRLLDQRLRRLRRHVNPRGRSLIEKMLISLNAVMTRASRHEQRLTALARASGLDGVICGHFHCAALHSKHGIVYANCGDWVDSFTAIAENMNGCLELLYHEDRQLFSEQAADLSPAPLGRGT